MFDIVLLNVLVIIPLFSSVLNIKLSIAFLICWSRPDLNIASIPCTTPESIWLICPSFALLTKAVNAVFRRSSAILASSEVFIPILNIAFLNCLNIFSALAPWIFKSEAVIPDVIHDLNADIVLLYSGIDIPVSHIGCPSLLYLGNDSIIVETKSLIWPSISTSSLVVQVLNISVLAPSYTYLSYASLIEEYFLFTLINDACCSSKESKFLSIEYASLAALYSSEFISPL